MSDKEVTITVSGPSGSGTAALMMLIGDALKEYGVAVRHQDPNFEKIEEARDLPWTLRILNTSPKVLLVEKQHTVLQSAAWRHFYGSNPTTESFTGDSQ